MTLAYYGDTSHVILDVGAKELEVNVQNDSRTGGAEASERGQKLWSCNSIPTTRSSSPNKVSSWHSKLTSKATHPAMEAFRRENRKGTRFEATYAGALSFMRRKYTRDLTGADIAITGVPFDQAVYRSA